MKSLRRFFSLLAVLAFLAIPVFAQNASEPSADKGGEASSGLSAAFLEPLYSAASGEDLDTRFSASPKLLKNLTLDIYNFDLSAVLKKNLPLDYSQLTGDSLKDIQFALKQKQTIQLERAKLDVSNSESKRTNTGLCVYKQNLPKLEDGIYLFRLYSKDSKVAIRESLQIVSISNLQLACLTSGTAYGILWVLDRQNGSSLCADQVFYQTYSPDQKVSSTTLHCSPDGLINLPTLSEGASSICLVVKGKQQAAVVSVDSARISKRWKAFLWCDSRSVAPGRTLTYKAVLHDVFTGAALSEAAKEVFQVSLCSLRNETVVKSKAALGFSGTLSGVIELPKDLPREPYVLVLKDGQGANVASCGLASSLPDYTDIKFNIEPNAPSFTVGQDVALNISLADADNLPIAGREITLNFSVCQVKARSGHEVGSLGVEASSSFVASSKLPTVKTITNLAGQAQIKFTCPSSISTDSQLAVVRVQATARGKQNRLYRSACSFSIVSAPGFLSLDGPREIRSNSFAQYLIQASDFSGMPMAGLALEVSAISENGKTIEIGKYTSDSKGCCLFNWQPNLAGNYSVCVRAVDGAKAPSSNGTNLDITKLQAINSVVVYSDNENRFDVDISKRFVKVGESSEIKIYAPQSVKKALLVLDRDGILSRYVVNLTDGCASLTVPFKKKFAPAVRVAALAYIDGELKKVEELVYVHDSEQVFNIKASLASNPISGQTVDLNLTALDNKGGRLVSLLNVRLIGPEEQPYLCQDSIFKAFCSPDNWRKMVVNFEEQERIGSTEEFSDSVPVILYPENQSIEVAKVRTIPDSGTAKCAIAMPDEEGSWKLLVTGVTEDGRIGQTILPLVLKRNIEANITGPTAINRGDFAKYSVKLQNCTDKELSFEMVVKAEDTSVLLVQDTRSASESGEASKITLKAHGSSIFNFMVKSGLPGASNIVVELKGQDGVERYTQPVEVCPLATIYSQDASALLQRQADLKLDRFRKDFIGRVFDRNLNVEITNGLAGILASSVHNFSNLSGGNGESVLASWAAPVVCSAPFMKHNLKIPSYFGLTPERAQDSLLSLQMAQNKDGGFGWRSSLASDPIYTTMIVRYLNVLRETGISEVEPLIKSSEAYLNKVRSALNLDERLVLSLAFREPKISNSDLNEALKNVDKLENPAFIALVRYLDLTGKREEAKRLWKNANKRFLTASNASFVGETDSKIESSYWRGDTSLTDCKTTSLALITNLSLEGDNAGSQALLNWLLSNRCGQAWNTASDTLVALEAISTYMYRFYEAPKEFSYGIWINGNELESGNGLAEKSDWHRSFALSVSQLPDSPLNIKVIKSGSDLVWVHVHESITVHGLPEAGYRKETSATSIDSVTDAPFFISSQCRIIESQKGEVHPMGEGIFGRLGDEAIIDLKVSSQENKRYAVVNLPYIGGLDIANVEGLQGLNASFDKQANCLYITFLPKGEHIFKLKGKLVHQGEFTSEPAVLRFNNSPFECAQAAPFTLIVGE